ncbi:hypothetical protein PQI66_09880 [Corynebacterium sp. USCH3]|uniref:hypothetical protein n=1 Tax=Corynebacterium sp. USCH3 TaxID=3024840 RepID=UPI0030B7705A
MSIHDDAQAVLQAVYDLEQQRIHMPHLERVAEQADLPAEQADRAVAWLRDREYLSGAGGSWGGGFARMKTTTKGQNIIEFGRHVRDVEGASEQPAGTTVNNNMNGGNLHQQVGDGNHQDITIGVSTNELRNLISALRDAGATDAANEVDQVTRGGNDVSGAKKALGIAVSALSAAASMASVGTAITAVF